MQWFVMDQRMCTAQSAGVPACACRQHQQVMDMLVLLLLLLLLLLLCFFADGNLVELFALDSDCHQRNGTTKDSIQAKWLQAALANSTATWKLVMLHHSPYSSSSSHGSNPRMHW
jgi:hypothetical protein